ncbi:PREDICTED: chitobiosyldiphosphodolichol beta-mannosyltransferase [Nicrophorus vespilloides]|uniref:Beta-1,4-mannosyltransferase n=1 Tax=Nicrophorus vespilloides TaxID=110193 RepID=A0ABM1N4Y2_NICVS|nr:PREDICTED: chitobiosyldiphosphodolichol beta-mannosyltransferase [Nicrophorus vespilloides]
MLQKSVCVVVLGDIGRSPRMQYHSRSFAEEGHKVDIVGYQGATPIESLTTQPLVSFHYLNPFPNIPCPRFLNYILKTIWQTINLLFVLLIIRKANLLIVQNPPAVPTLMVCYLYKLITRAQLAIDWHNYAHTIMALNVGQKNPLVKLTKWMEKFFGQKADYNLCVTKEMKRDLKTAWNIDATTLYDRPPEIFDSITLEQKHEVLNCLGLKYKELLSEEDTGTAFTKLSELGEVELRKKRPGLLVSSTSWTEDEDFSVLLSALQNYEESCVNGNQLNLPKLICLITGKGPLKDFYCKKIEDLRLKNITILTPWLESKDYPLILAAADLGVCLHTSSSGLDLPMKVVDMFGCGLPVCAYNFKCLGELVQHDVNSFVFNNSDELSKQLSSWFKDFPENQEIEEKRAGFKKELENFQQLRWRENWTKIASPVFN